MAVAVVPALLRDAEAEASLCPGDFVLIFYRDDTVWHERAVLWKFGRRWEVVTPDNDKYQEILKPGRGGPLKLIKLEADGLVPSDLVEPVYRFTSYPVAAGHNARLKASFEAARRSEGDQVQLFNSVKDYMGREVAPDQIVGRAALPRRLPGKTSRPLPAGRGASTAVVPADSADAAGDAWKEALRRPDGSPDGMVWVLAETADEVLQVGTEVMLDTVRDYVVGGNNALHDIGGKWVRCQLMRVEEVPEFVKKVRALYNVAPSGGGPMIPLDKGGGTPVPSEAAAEVQDDEVRTLSVDIDEQGDRFKEWRVVLKESRSYPWPQVPIDLGPWTLLDLMKAMGRNGGDAQTWLTAWGRSKGLQDHDRVMHELRALVDTLYYAATYDQLNCPALLSFEILNRRICSLVEAHRSPSNPNWSASQFYEVTKTPDDVIPDTLRAHVTRKEKEHRELMDGRRRLTAPAASSSAADAGAEALADDGLPGGGKGGKAGKPRGAKAKAKSLAAPDKP